MNDGWDAMMTAAFGDARVSTNEAKGFGDLPMLHSKPFLPCYSASGTAFMLRQIVNRGALQSGDLEAIHAACVLLERASAEGRI